MIDHKTVERFEEIVDRELDKIIKKDDLTPAEVENAEKAMKLLCKMKEYVEYDSMEEMGGYSQRRPYQQRIYDQGRNSYERGRGMRSGKLSMSWGSPSYSRNDEYSRHGNNDMMIEKLEAMRNEYAGDPETMRAIDECIDKVASMK